MKGQPIPGRGAVYTASRLFIDAATVVSPGAIAVENGIVVAAGAPADVAAAVPARFGRIDLPGTAILPGLVNSHTHLQIPRLDAGPEAAGLPSPPTFVDWILRVIAWKRGASPGEFASRLRAAESASLACGTTAVGEIAGPDPRAYASCPLRARVYAEGIGFLPGDAGYAFHAVETALSILGEISTRLETLRPGLSPHTLYTAGPKLLGLLAGLSTRDRLPAAIHLAESPAEMEFLRTGRGEIAERLYPAVGKDVSFFRGIGATIPAYLRAAGLLREGLCLVHNVHLSREEVDELRAGGARFVLCPRSNAAHGNGSPDVTHFVDSGAPFSLGTDSLGSVPTLSMWEEMREARSLYGGRLPDADLCTVLLRAATDGGAATLALPGGTLFPGAPADFVAVDDPGGEGARACSRLIERTGAANVALTVVAGRRLHDRTSAESPRKGP